jgi:hypothetical protein
MSKKNFVIQTFGLILFFIFAPLIIVLKNIVLMWENSRILKDIKEEYPKAVLRYKELYKFDFDYDKYNEHQINKHIDELNCLNKS